MSAGRTITTQWDGDDTIVVHGIHYMNNLGLFLFKDVISLGVAFYLISYFGEKAMISEVNDRSIMRAAYQDCWRAWARGAYVRIRQSTVVSKVIPRFTVNE